MSKYVVAAVHAWYKEAFEHDIAPLPGHWTYIDSGEGLTLEAIRKIDPQYIFFLHWSWKVPEEILNAYRCIAFHMADVPYGRGGSPLQNLIIRGHKTTKLTALQMTEQFDAGPVYLKCDLSLEGRAQDIYIRASQLAARMIRRVITEDITPTPQIGEVTVFKRRRPEESEIPELGSLDRLYDFIRMLDAEGYPRAFLNHGLHRYEFSNASLEEEHLKAEVKVTPLEEKA